MGDHRKALNAKSKNESELRLVPNRKTSNRNRENMIKNETHPNNIVTDALDASRAGDTSILAEGMEFGREKRQSTASEEISTSDSNMLASRTKRRRGRPRLGVSRSSGRLREIDTSWKDGRSIFPKRSSQVGSRYQVDFLPPAGTVETEKHLLTETK